jgi:hypothetical protein
MQQQEDLMEDPLYDSVQEYQDSNDVDDATMLKMVCEIAEDVGGYSLKEEILNLLERRLNPDEAA